MVKRWKLVSATSLLVAGLYGCQFTPKATTLATALPINQQIAQAEVPGDQTGLPEAEGTSDTGQPVVVPVKTLAQKLAENDATKKPASTEGAKRKKARNGEMAEYKRDYTEYIKKPDLLGFHPREEEFEKVLDTIRNQFVEGSKDDKLQTGVKKEVKLFLDEANLDHLQAAVKKDLAPYPGEAKEDKLAGKIRREFLLFLEKGNATQLQTNIDKELKSYTQRSKDAKLPVALRKDIGVFVEQAKVDDRSLRKLDGVAVDQEFSKVQDALGARCNKDLLGYVTMMGALESLKDPYTVLLTPEEVKKLKEQLQSTTFGGIGIYIEIDHDHGNQLTVFEPIEGTPAANAGLEAGDRIMKINGKPTKGVTIDVAQSRIRGDVGSTVTLSIERRKENLEIPVVRGKITVVSVTKKIYPGQIGYIRLRTFGSETGAELEKALNELRAEKVKGIILDLRNNGGGYIDAAVKVVGQFAPAKSLVVYTIDRDKHKRLYPTTDPGGVGVPVVCMINEFSASASEITAGALRDLKIATLVGDHSFGKGSVQQLFPLDQSFPPRADESAELKLTIARFYTPNGDVIDKQGIEPQVVVDMEPRYVGKIEHDVQLKKALELLGGKPAASQP